MSRRQPEPCRNFLRGSCRYGANCRYLHVSPNQNQNQNQNQSKPSTNPFGFGSSQFSHQQQPQQQQQQKPNPFGFGVQNKNSTAPFQTSSKPFENKWTRSTSTTSKQTDPQTLASVHTCADAESCKNIIADDFKNEAPIWKLTCYAHHKHLPCEIHGDISFEELRAVAYEEAKQGHSLQSIVERERNLLQSKLSEFENLLRKPNNNLGLTSQSNAASTFTSFSQLGAANNITSGFSPAPSSAPNNLFGQPSFLQNTSQQPMQPDMKFGTSVGTFGNQLTNQNKAFGSLQAPAPNFSFGRAPNTNANLNMTGSQLFTSTFPSANTGNNSASSKQQQQLLTLGLGFSKASPPSEEKQEEGTDDGIWLKEKWSIGEPFENKWTRSTSTTSMQTDPQTRASVHTCADAESCKNIIADDFKNEAPIWKLTCYAHHKHLPCEIHGDISFEELRAVAYEEAKQGHSLQSIVERERNLLQSKLSEFENLLRKPNNNLGLTSQSNAASPFTSFSQFGAASNITSGFRPAPSSAPNNLFGQPSFLQNTNRQPMQPDMKFGTSVGTFGNQLTNQNKAFGSLQAPAPNFSFGKAPNTNASLNMIGSQLFTSTFPSANTGNNSASSMQQHQLLTPGLGFSKASPPPEEKQEEGTDDGIWLKEKWSVGEIPETAPPLRICT